MSNYYKFRGGLVELLVVFLDIQSNYDFEVVASIYDILSLITNDKF